MSRFRCFSRDTDDSDSDEETGKRARSRSSSSDEVKPPRPKARKMDPMMCSLDDIIVDRKIAPDEFTKPGEQKYVTKQQFRKEVEKKYQAQRQVSEPRPRKREYDIKVDRNIIAQNEFAKPGEQKRVSKQQFREEVEKKYQEQQQVSEPLPQKREKDDPKMSSLQDIIVNRNIAEDEFTKPEEKKRVIKQTFRNEVEKKYQAQQQVSEPRPQKREKDPKMCSLDDIIVDRNIPEDEFKPGDQKRFDKQQFRKEGEKKYQAQQQGSELGPQKGVKDPKMCSLDDIIVDRNITKDQFTKPARKKRLSKEEFRRQVEEKYKAEQQASLPPALPTWEEERRPGLLTTRPKDDDMLDEREFIDYVRGYPSYRVLTPFQVVSIYSHLGLIVDVRIGRKCNFDPEKDDPSRKWRCVVKSGKVMEICDSASIEFSREMACSRFWKTVLKLHPYADIPFHQVPNELFQDTAILNFIEERAIGVGPLSFEYSVEIIEDERRGFRKKFRCVYHLGEEADFYGSADNKLEARLTAARKACLYLTGGWGYPFPTYYICSYCDINVDYHFGKCETFARLSLKKMDDIGFEIPDSKKHLFISDKGEMSGSNSKVRNEEEDSGKDDNSGTGTTSDTSGRSRSTHSYSR